MPSEPSALRPILPMASQGHTCPWEIAGHRYLATVWTEAEWATLPRSDRPRDAQPVEGLGWMTLRPEAKPGPAS